MALQIGALLAERYRILRVLGQGGMGAVYLATDQSLGLPCAVKENLNLSPDSERLFRREATLLATLRHRHLPRVTNHFVLDNQQYLVMDYVEGEDLKQRLERQGALPEALVRQWAEQLCDALTYLHSLNPPVIHRDIKPANIKLTPSGDVMLVDFGVARPAATAADHHTATNTLAFTPGFTPPEQYGLGRTDARADQYALAATLYNLLTGQAPPDSVERLLGNVALIAPEALRPELSPGLVAALTRALAVQPEDRFASVAAFRVALAAAPPPAAPAPKTDPTETVVRRPAGPGAPPPPAPVTPDVPEGATLIKPPTPSAPLSSEPPVPTGATLLQRPSSPSPTGQSAAPPPTMFEPGGLGALSAGAPPPTLFEPGGGLAGAAPPPVINPPAAYGGPPTGPMASPVPAAAPLPPVPAAAPPARRPRPRWLMPVALGCGFLVLAAAALAGGSALGLYFTNRNATPTTAALATETAPLVVAPSETPPPPVDTPAASATSAVGDTVAPPSATPTEPGAADTPEPTLTVAPAGPPLGGGTGRLAFISRRDGQFYQVYTMNADGSDVQQLTTDPTDKWNPTWPYNGTQLAWSPDGAQLLYVADGGPGNVLDLWVINADGTDPQNLTHNKGDDVQPSWCHDGTIWFASNRINGVQQIFGATLADLLAGVRPFNFSGTHNNPREFDPSPFPDCRRLVFTSTLDGAREIWRYFPDCPECYRKVATYKDQNGSAEQPALSPDGTLLAYTRVLADSREIIVMDPNDRTTAQQLTSSLQNYSPAWSPDGQWIAFNSDRDGNREVYIMQANGAGQTNLSQNTAGDTDPVWQPSAP
ncbi:MAG: PD40 domain-containing protein [Anaerolineales bacterium]|nr:PD40 domain-containing protein [Anaerolineales bacterium]